MTVQSTEAPAVKVGDFFVCSWGYDQTNIDFYKVVGLTKSGKSVKVQKWRSATVESDEFGSHDKVVPGDAPATWIDWSGVDQDADFWTKQEQKVERDVPVETKRLRFWGGEGKYSVSFSVNSYSSAYRFDGTPQYQTGPYAGH